MTPPLLSPIRGPPPTIAIFLIVGDVVYIIPKMLMNANVIKNGVYGMRIAGGNMKVNSVLSL
jgi:hypothetical protein